MNTDRPEPYPHGHCEYRQHPWSSHCGKRGRWWFRGEIRCGEHKDAVS